MDSKVNLPVLRDTGESKSTLALLKLLTNSQNHCAISMTNVKN